MFDFLKRKNKPEKEFCFIWYEKLQSKGKCFYTQPFRTKIKAKDYETAKEKLTQFALSKMELIIIPEKQFGKSDLSKLDAEFKKISDEMERLINNIYKI